jgi:hypothetical protein
MSFPHCSVNRACDGVGAAQVDDDIPVGLDSIHEGAEAAAAAIEATPGEAHHDRPVPPGEKRLLQQWRCRAALEWRAC